MKTLNNVKDKKNIFWYSKEMLEMDIEKYMVLLLIILGSNSCITTTVTWEVNTNTIRIGLQTNYLLILLNLKEYYLVKNTIVTKITIAKEIITQSQFILSS